MNYDLAEFERLVSEGYLRKSHNDDLVLYTYTEKTTFDRKWDTKYTRDARGIIFERATGKLIAQSFPKFFNLGEMPESQIPNLPNEPYVVTEKMDGSLGIVYFYNGTWRVATKGSLNSVQAQKAVELLQKYNINELLRGDTLLVEIIYPENKIVVNYGGEEKLVLLGGYHTNGIELSVEELKEISSATKLPLVNSYSYSINEMIELQKTLPKDREGFVVRYADGLRVKIKGAEYVKIHKLISGISPLSIWETMQDGIVPISYLAQLPEEFRGDFEPMAKELEIQYAQIADEINNDVSKLPIKITNDLAKAELKTLGLFLASQNRLLHPGAMFPLATKKYDVLNKYIMKHIRPDGNIIKILS
jgi:RNA ligase